MCRYDGLPQEKRTERLLDIVSAADDVLAAIDTTELAVHQVGITAGHVALHFMLLAP